MVKPSVTDVAIVRIKDGFGALTIKLKKADMLLLPTVGIQT
jgi:hypothetical protein